MLTSLKSCCSPCTWHCHACCRERERERERDARVNSSTECGHPIRQIWIRWNTASVVYFKRGLPFADPWCERVERTSAEGVVSRLPDHTIITAAIAQWRSRLTACVRVNGGHFEHQFWASDFLLCFVCFIDTVFCKCDRYKHVQSANIVWNVLLLCLILSHGMVATQPTCGRKFLRRWLWHSVTKGCARKIMKICQYL